MNNTEQTITDYIASLPMSGMLFRDIGQSFCHSVRNPDWFYQSAGETPDEELPVVYRYKLCGDFDHIRQAMDIFDRDDNGYIFEKKIHSVDNRDNNYDTELEFSAYSKRECFQNLVNSCDFPDDMSLHLLTKTT